MRMALSGAATFPGEKAIGKFEYGVTSDGTIGLVFTAVSEDDDATAYNPRINYGWVQENNHSKSIMALLNVGHAVFGYVDEVQDCESFATNKNVYVLAVLYSIVNRKGVKVTENSHVQGRTQPGPAKGRRIVEKATDKELESGWVRQVAFRSSYPNSCSVEYMRDKAKECARLSRQGQNDLRKVTMASSDGQRINIPAHIDHEAGKVVALVDGKPFEWKPHYRPTTGRLTAPEIMTKRKLDDIWRELEMEHGRKLTISDIQKRNRIETAKAKRKCTEHAAFNGKEHELQMSDDVYTPAVPYAVKVVHLKELIEKIISEITFCFGSIEDHDGNLDVAFEVKNTIAGCINAISEVVMTPEGVESAQMAASTILSVMHRDGQNSKLRLILETAEEIFHPLLKIRHSEFVDNENIPAGSENENSGSDEKDGSRALAKTAPGDSGRKVLINIDKSISLQRQIQKEKEHERKFHGLPIIRREGPLRRKVRQEGDVEVEDDLRFPSSDPYAPLPSSPPTKGDNYSAKSRALLYEHGINNGPKPKHPGFEIAEMIAMQDNSSGENQDDDNEEALADEALADEALAQEEIDETQFLEDVLGAKYLDTLAELDY
ncbi:hypothetical protein BJ508DRAFT_332335 [Ascobolus immersus RN42]|uniref:Uncharacterized protein n=1 Tax=Ascobolus immersus RN42 TaxID=1160509 RepID=A0A3N4HQF8_ASCIM|nr:hypothetical protein BJ508DRAFT_332335 [Ascobolus immersus RN42]